MPVLFALNVPPFATKASRAFPGDAGTNPTRRRRLQGRKGKLKEHLLPGEKDSGFSLSFHPDMQMSKPCGCALQGHVSYTASSLSCFLLDFTTAHPKVASNHGDSNDCATSIVTMMHVVLAHCTVPCGWHYIIIHILTSRETEGR